jgi:hypothetical protein
MGIKLSQISDGSIKVIARIDDSLVLNDETFGKYLETNDESLLEFVPGSQSTRFVLRKVLPYSLAQKVQNKQVKFEKGEAQFQMSFMAEEVRCCLIGIENPADLPDDQQIKFSRDGDGGASEELMSRLMAAGIVNDLYVARKNLMEGKGKGDLKKS